MANVRLPIKTRAISSIGTFLANTVNSQLTIYGIAIKIAVCFRPIFSAKIPAGMAPMSAPIGKQDAIHVDSPGVVGSVEFALSNCAVTGEVHDRPVPAATALMQTADVEKMNEMIDVCYTMHVAVLRTRHNEPATKTRKPEANRQNEKLVSII